ncbi:MAG TPA: hypothetical protein PLU49_11945 [Saprospiraceae bacterium]|mgnify:CR=1 FL=1|nr:hypothetical protein [Saprospiraceae bacterium]
MSKPVQLSVTCPHCNESFMTESRYINNEATIKVMISNPQGEKGFIWLSSIYGDYNFSTKIKFQEGEVIEFYCPHCEKSLSAKNEKCDLCEAPIVRMDCTIGGTLSICSRSGCKKHYVVFEDLESTIKKFYEEFG